MSPQVDDSILEEAAPLTRASEAAAAAAGRLGDELEEGFGDAKEEVERLFGTLQAQLREYVDETFDARLARGDGGQIAGFGPRLVILAFLLGAGLVFAGVILGALIAKF